MQLRELETKNVVMGIITGIVVGTVLIVAVSVGFGWWAYKLHERQETTYDEQGRVVARARMDKSTPTRPTAHDERGGWIWKL